jgi:hypothetical protein
MVQVDQLKPTLLTPPGRSLLETRPMRSRYGRDDLGDPDTLVRSAGVPRISVDRMVSACFRLARTHTARAHCKAPGAAGVIRFIWFI